MNDDPPPPAPDPVPEPPAPDPATPEPSGAESGDDLATRLARLVDAGLKPGADVLRFAERRMQPVWEIASEPESRWAASAAIALAIVLQLTLPIQFTIHPTWAISAIEIALLVGLLIADPKRASAGTSPLRKLSVFLVFVLTATNGWSAVKLIRGLIEGSPAMAEPVKLLATGGAIWATNMIAFALWYWEFDSGGPASRSRGEVEHPDFLFAQMQTPELAPVGWKPEFVDYLYLSFTNGAAFSPTDVLPLTSRAKLTMMLQSIVSLVTVALVVARAVNILG